jgi:hypothetical protein
VNNLLYSFHVHDKRTGANLRVYHFLKAEHGLDDVRQRRIKVAQIDRLNDPFEFLGVASRDAAVRQRYRNLKDALAKQMGVLCFSQNWRNPVQWSHYAEHHRGLCLGFDITPTVNFRKVNYVERRLKAPSKRRDKAENVRHMIEILTTKFRHWEYEQEYRLFVPLPSIDEKTEFYWHDFADGLRLSEIVIGARSALTHRDVLDALGQSDGSVPVRKARLAFQSFSVVTQKDARRWHYTIASASRLGERVSGR